MWSLNREYNNYFKCKDIATGITNCFQNLGGFVSQLLIAELIDISWNNRGANDYINNTNDGNYTVNDYNYGFILIPIAVFLAIISSLLMKETNAKNLDAQYYGPI